MYEKVFEAVDTALCIHEHTEKYLRDENAKLTSENAELKAKLRDMSDLLKQLQGGDEK